MPLARVTSEGVRNMCNVQLDAQNANPKYVGVSNKQKILILKSEYFVELALCARDNFVQYFLMYKNNKEHRVGRIVIRMSVRPWSVVDLGSQVVHAEGFSSVAVAAEATEALSSGEGWHARAGNLAYNAARYFGWLIPYTIGL